MYFVTDFDGLSACHCLNTDILLHVKDALHEQICQEVNSNCEWEKDSLVLLLETNIF